MKIKFLSLFILSGIFILGSYVRADEGSGGAAPAAAVGYNQAGFTAAESNAAAVATVTRCPECTSVKAIMATISTAAKACDAARDATDTACSEATSSFAREALSTVQEYGNLVLMVASANSACSALTDALKKGNLLLQLYKGACSTAKGTCDASCGSAVSGLQKLDAALAKAIPNIQANITSCSENPEVPCTATEAHLKAAQALSSFAKSEYNQGSLQAMGGKKSFCAVQAAKSMAGGTQQMAMAMQMALQTNKCDKQTSSSLNTSVDSSETYCAQHPAEAQCNCGLDSQKNTARCLCQLDPRSSACPNGLAKAGSGIAEKIGVGNLTTSAAGKVTPKVDINGDSLSDEKINFPKSADNGGSGIGGGGSGPSAGGGGGSGNQLGPVGGAGGGGSVGKISGSALGGWGGGSAGGRFGGGSNSDENNALKKYLPGQKNDPKRKIAGSSGFGTEITGQGGKSNWDKVKERYKDNTPTLLGN